MPPVDLRQHGRNDRGDEAAGGAQDEAGRDADPGGGGEAEQDGPRGRPKAAHGECRGTADPPDHPLAGEAGQDHAEGDRRGVECHRAVAEAELDL